MANTTRILYCIDCKKDIHQTPDLREALDERDYHGIQFLHTVDVMVELEGRRIKLTGVLEGGRCLNLA